MAQRRRRSLLSGSDKPEGVEGGEAGAPEEGTPAEPSVSGSPAAEAGDGPVVSASEPAAAVPEEPEPVAAVPEEPWAAAPAAHAAPEPDPWAAEPTPPAADPWAAAPQAPAADPWAPAPPPAADAYEVSEERRSVGGYQSTAKNLADTTDSGWSSSAFRSGGGQPSLPPGWDTPSVSDDGPVRPTSPFSNKAEFFSEEPPTEEQPSAVYENRSMSQSAPMNVPEAGAIPALGGRKTFGAAPGPSFVTSGAPEVGAPSGKSFGAAPAASGANRPSYLPPETPKKPPLRASTPKASPAPAPARAALTDDDDDEKPAGPPAALLAGGFIVIVLGIVVLGLVVMIGTGMFATAPVVPPPPAVVILPPPPPPVQVANDTDVPAIAADPAAVDVTTPPATKVPPPATKVPPVTTTPPPETKAVAKVPPPVDKPKDTKKVTKSPAGAKGTLKIRSNRRVLVKVNGQPKDYTPLDLPADAGAYSITAALPGKPDSEQSFTVDLKSGVTESVNFSF